MITKKEFDSIIEIRDSETVNMNETSKVAALADVSEETVKEFRSDFDSLSAKYDVKQH